VEHLAGGAGRLLGVFSRRHCSRNHRTFGISECLPAFTAIGWPGTTITAVSAVTVLAILHLPAGKRNDPGIRASLTPGGFLPAPLDLSVETIILGAVRYLIPFGRHGRLPQPVAASSLRPLQVSAPPVKAVFVSCAAAGHVPGRFAGDCGESAINAVAWMRILAAERTQHSRPAAQPARSTAGPQHSQPGAASTWRFAGWACPVFRCGAANCPLMRRRSAGPARRWRRFFPPEQLLQYGFSERLLFLTQLLR
jgi:hypothetical protein